MYIELPVPLIKHQLKKITLNSGAKLKYKTYSTRIISISVSTFLFPIKFILVHPFLIISLLLCVLKYSFVY